MNHHVADNMWSRTEDIFSNAKMKVALSYKSDPGYLDDLSSSCSGADDYWSPFKFGDSFYLLESCSLDVYEAL